MQKLTFGRGAVLQKSSAHNRLFAGIGEELDTVFETMYSL
jgi:hypothetical protein